MRVLFLDFDGVLNSRRYPAWIEPAPYQAKQRGVAREHVAHLNRVCQHAKAVVVITSAWRYLHPLEQLVAVLEAAGFDGEVIDATDKLPSDRGLQIQRWLDAHPEVKAFAIVDDSTDMAHLAPYLVETTDEDGFQQEHAARLIDMLLEAA